MTDTHTEFIVTGHELSSLLGAVARAATAKARTQATADARAGVVRRSGPAAVAELRARALTAAVDDAAEWAEFEHDMDQRAGLA